MSRTTQSITLVLLGAGLAVTVAVASCDDRGRRYGGVSTGGSSTYDPAYPGATTGPAYAYGRGGSSAAYSYRGAPAYGRPWFGGSVFRGTSGFFSSPSRRSGTSGTGSTGSGSAAAGGSHAAESHGSSGGTHGTTFGGFGSHASGSAAA